MIGRVQLIQLNGCKPNHFNPSNCNNNNKKDTSYSIYAQEREVVYIPKDEAISLSLQSNQSESINPNAYSFTQKLELKNKINSFFQKDSITKLSFHSKGKYLNNSIVNHQNSLNKTYYQ